MSVELHTLPAVQGAGTLTLEAAGRRQCQSVSMHMQHARITQCRYRMLWKTGSPCPRPACRSVRCTAYNVDPAFTRGSMLALCLYTPACADVVAVRRTAQARLGRHAAAAARPADGRRGGGAAAGRRLVSARRGSAGVRRRRLGAAEAAGEAAAGVLQAHAARHRPDWQPSSSSPLSPLPRPCSVSTAVAPSLLPSALVLPHGALSLVCARGISVLLGSGRRC